jgi:hypothetical protein
MTRHHRAAIALGTGWELLHSAAIVIRHRLGDWSRPDDS